MNFRVSWLSVGALLATTTNVCASPIDMLNLIAPKATPVPSSDTGDVKSQPALSPRRYSYGNDDYGDDGNSTRSILIGVMIPVAAIIICVIVVLAVKARKGEPRIPATIARGVLPLNNPNNRAQRTSINQPRRPPTATLPPYTPGNTTTRSAPPEPAITAVRAAQAVSADPGQTTTRTAPPLVPMIMIPAPSYTPGTTTTTPRPETPADTTSSPMRSTAALLPTRTSSPRPSSDTASISPPDTTTSMTTASRTTTRAAPPPPPDRVGTPPPPYSRDPV
ncbi:uncharacterized protein APUU_50383A [Aspergillus puulaauensis]|uniref:Mid2 domain-containing protein n=1 Tax=Aspergillus puulaauensis TaxID=1220207 RepID=A0A7R7XQ54_9EURO|nr:uncharacterized protein APUU_50383A [Aspergillus puulaauensis]BCS25672.1 hypothetical protein APUU_50383A [Aspergillus puulaauensis]